MTHYTHHIISNLGKVKNHLHIHGLLVLARARYSCVHPCDVFYYVVSFKIIWGGGTPVGNQGLLLVILSGFISDRLKGSYTVLLIKPGSAV